MRYGYVRVVGVCSRFDHIVHVRRDLPEPLFPFETYTQVIEVMQGTLLARDYLTWQLSSSLWDARRTEAA